MGFLQGNPHTEWMEQTMRERRPGRSKRDWSPRMWGMEAPWAHMAWAFRLLWELCIALKEI